MTDSTENGSIGGFVDAHTPPKTNRSGRETFVERVDKFVAASKSWLSDVDDLAIGILYALAEELDGKITGALMAQFGMTYRDLVKRAPGRNPDDEDPVAKAIREAAEKRGQP